MYLGQQWNIDPCCYSDWSYSTRVHLAAPQGAMCSVMHNNGSRAELNFALLERKVKGNSKSFVHERKYNSTPSSKISWHNGQIKAFFYKNNGASRKLAKCFYCSAKKMATRRSERRVTRSTSTRPEGESLKRTELQQTEIRFRKACNQINLLNRKMESIHKRYNCAKKNNHRVFRYKLRLRLAVVEGLRNMYYEYANKKVLGPTTVN